MINKIFLYDSENNRIELNTPEILLVREFAKLMENDRNITKQDPKGELKTRAFREFQYIWLAIDWKSIYADYLEQDRHKEALLDSKLTEKEFNDPDFRAACRKYREIQESTRSIRMLHAAQITVDKLINYFNNINPEERDDATGKPIYKVKDIQAEVSNLSKVNDELNALEKQVKSEIQESSNIRADAVDGYLPYNY